MSSKSSSSGNAFVSTAMTVPRFMEAKKRGHKLCVLTAYDHLWAGLLDSAESQLHVPARIGYPAALSRMPEELVQPEYATAIGMLLYTHRTRVLKAAEDHSLRAKLRAITAAPPNRRGDKAACSRLLPSP